MILFLIFHLSKSDEPPTSAANYNHFKPNNYIDGNETFYRMPPVSVATSIAMGTMMMNNGMQSRGPPRFQSNNNLGKFSNFIFAPRSNK